MLKKSAEKVGRRHFIHHEASSGARVVAASQMIMGDNGASNSSWEEMNQEKIGGALNPTASSFSFNPGTTAFVPGGSTSSAPPPPSANDLAAELAAMAAIARGESSEQKKDTGAPAEIKKAVPGEKKESTNNEPKKTVPGEKKESTNTEPVATYTPEELAARKEKITATLAEIDAVRPYFCLLTIPLLPTIPLASHPTPLAIS